MSLEKFFEDLENQKLAPLLRIQGDDPYLQREWKMALQRQGIEFVECDLKKTGPRTEAEELGSGLSLFSAKRLLCLTHPAPLSQWSKLSLEIWRRLAQQADGESFSLVLMSPADKRLKWDSLAFDTEVTFEVSPEKKLFWIERMNQRRGKELNKSQLQFLASFEDDLLLLDNWVELWSLGGEIWAEKTLGWKAEGKHREVGAANPAFAWVDAVIQGDQKGALKNLRRLEDDSQEALQLMGLLTKSVRILAALDLNLSTKGQPPFLVDKLKARRHRAQKLLQKCQELDWKLKSSAVDKFTLLSTLL